MALWWIGNLVLLFVIIPVVVILLRGVLEAALTVRRTLEDIGEVGGVMVKDLDNILELVQTVSHANQISLGLGRYGAALDKVL